MGKAERQQLLDCQPPNYTSENVSKTSQSEQYKECYRILPGLAEQVAKCQDLHKRGFVWVDGDRDAPKMRTLPYPSGNMQIDAMFLNYPSNRVLILRTGISSENANIYFFPWQPENISDGYYQPTMK